MKTQGEILFKQHFERSRSPRSEAYKKGVLHGIQCILKEGRYGEIPYTPGTAELDAWFAGADEGYWIARNWLANRRIVDER